MACRGSCRIRYGPCDADRAGHSGIAGHRRSGKRAIGQYRPDRNREAVRGRWSRSWNMIRGIPTHRGNALELLLLVFAYGVGQPAAPIPRWPKLAAAVA